VLCFTAARSRHGAVAVHGTAAGTAELETDLLVPDHRPVDAATVKPAAEVRQIW
jgi:hypothetical protein